MYLLNGRWEVRGWRLEYSRTLFRVLAVISCKSPALLTQGFLKINSGDDVRRPNTHLQNFTVYLRTLNALFISKAEILRFNSSGIGISQFLHNPTSNFELLTSKSRSSPRPISTGPLNPLLNLYARPIYHVVFMGSYSLMGWET